MVNENIENQATTKPDKGSSHQKNTTEVEILTPNKACRIKLRACPIPESVSVFLESNTQLLKEAFSSSRKHSLQSLKSEQMMRIKNKISELFKEEIEEKKDFEIIDIDSIVAFGPKNRGPNFLVDATGQHIFPSIWQEDSEIPESDNSPTSLYQNSFVNGFQLASASGPLCEEPLMGVAFLVTEWVFLSHEDKQSDPYGPISGQVMSAVREGCRKAFNCHPRRLKIAMYSCNIQVPGEALGEYYLLSFSSIIIYFSKNSGRFLS